MWAARVMLSILFGWAMFAVLSLGGGASATAGAERVPWAPRVPWPLPSGHAGVPSIMPAPAAWAWHPTQSIMPALAASVAAGADGSSTGRVDADRMDARRGVERVRVVMPDGVFLVYDAAVPADRPRKQAGFLAYWNQFETEELYVYGRLLTQKLDVGHALLAMEADFGVDTVLLTSADPTLRRALALAGEQAPDDTDWLPADPWTMLWLMGFDPDDEMGLVALEGDDPVAACCRMNDTCCARSASIIAEHLDPPPRDAGPDDVIAGAMIAGRCCSTGGGGGGGGGDHPLPPPPPPPPCGNATCGCDRCCSGSNCCESPDSCCEPNDCCGNSDRCCNPDNPCCGSTDPCCNLNDQCCGNPDPCCNDDNLCCGAGPCDPVCGDPCACMDCNDDDPCTEDECAGGQCTHTDRCPGQSCCNGACCSGACCGSACCEGRRSDGCCDPVEPFCCGDECCTYECCNDHCCGPCEECCGGNCCGRGCCEGMCCDDDNPCTTDLCVCTDETCTAHMCDWAPACDDGDPCTEDDCTVGECDSITCDHPPKCPPSGEPCQDDCCVEGVCYADPVPQPCAIIELSGEAGCPGSTVTLSGVMYNVGYCYGSYTIEAEKTGGNGIMESFGSAGAGLMPLACSEFAIGATIAADSPLGSATIKVTARSPEEDCPPQSPTSCSATATVTVMGPDLQFEGVSNEDEENPGGVLPVNNDDDNGNGMVDMEEDPGATAGEDDLVALSLSVTGATEGTVELTGGVGRVAVYRHADRSDPVQCPASWALSEMPGTLYAEGVSASASARDVRLTLKYEGPGGSCVDTVNLSVIQVETLVWEKGDPGNAELDGCPNNGGVRVFPDKLSPDDPSPETRRNVKLVATIEPPIAGVSVYFKVFDVDDPFDELNPTMPDVALIDADAGGPDNRPTGEQPWTASGTTDENGKAEVTFTVSMQPGNNYRAGASALQDALTQTPGGQTMQQVADALNPQGGGFTGYNVPLHWSPMLTVWRKLRLEADSMEAEPTAVDARNPDWQQRYVSDVTAHPETGTSTLHLSNELSGNNAHQYEGGRLTVLPGGPAFAVVDHTADAIMINQTLSPPLIPYVKDHDVVVKDDDPDGGLLPNLYTVTPLLANAFRDAYVDIADLEEVHNPRRYVAFDLYLTHNEMWWGVGWNNSIDVNSSTSYWVTHVVAGYQAGGWAAQPGDNDNDPDVLVDNSTYPLGPFWPSDGGYSETLVEGRTAGFGDYDSVIFRAAIVDLPQHPTAEEQTIAHELGHSAGDAASDAQHEEGGLMSSDTDEDLATFTAPTLRRFREVQEW